MKDPVAQAIDDLTETLARSLAYDIRRNAEIVTAMSALNETTALVVNNLEAILGIVEGETVIEKSKWCVDCEDHPAAEGEERCELCRHKNACEAAGMDWRITPP